MFNRYFQICAFVFLLTYTTFADDASQLAPELRGKGDQIAQNRFIL